MAEPIEICAAKARVAGVKICDFGRASRLNPEVVFTGCPACKRDSAGGVTIEEAAADMQRFLDRMR